jgi:hypothetical protein
VKDHCVPKGHSDKTVQFNSSDDSAFHETDNSGIRKQFDLSLSQLRIHPQLLGDNRIVLLQDLQRDNEKTRTLILRNQLDSALLLGWCGMIVRVYKYVGVEKCQPTHRS